MALRSRGDGPITLSVLDRLIDDDPKRSEELPLTRSQSLRELKAGVCRDLEWLFNSRQAMDAPDTSKQVRNSLYAYGLPDITALTVSSVRDRKRLSQILEEAVRLFEPRILNPRVVLASTEEGKVQKLRFIIEGLLRVDPAPEPVSFDTVLDMASGAYEVPGDSSAR
jgi:type VI secretion system protein ImpF